MAEAVFDHLVKEAGLGSIIKSDSAGTSSYHEGEAPHSGTMRVLKQHGINYQGHSRPLTDDDLDQFDYVIAMDRSHLDILDSLQQIVRNPNVKIGRLLDYAQGQKLRDVPDPYFDGRFAEVYDLVEVGARGLLEAIRKEKQLP